MAAINSLALSESLIIEYEVFKDEDCISKTVHSNFWSANTQLQIEAITVVGPHKRMILVY